MSKQLIMTSGGITSWLLGDIVCEYYGKDHCTFLFGDTLIEDEECYRLLIEGTAKTMGIDAEDLYLQVYSLPSLSQTEERRVFLTRLSQQVMKRIPSLIWLIEGRTPWEVFKDGRFIGNSRVDKCSMILKREICNQYRDNYFSKEQDKVHVGITRREKDRYYGTPNSPGIRQLTLEQGWDYRAHLIEAGLEGIDAIEIAKEQGIHIPRLYQMGFAHNNCGGFCVRAGHDHFRKLLKHFPERFEFHLQQEEKMRDYLGKNISILKDRRGGTVKPLPLVEFRLRNEKKELPPYGDTQGCGCFLD